MSDNELRPVSLTVANTLQNLATLIAAVLKLGLFSALSFHIKLYCYLDSNINYNEWIVSPSFISANPPLVWHVYFAVLETDHSYKVPHPLMSIKGTKHIYLVRTCYAWLSSTLNSTNWKLLRNDQESKKPCHNSCFLDVYKRLKVIKMLKNQNVCDHKVIISGTWWKFTYNLVLLD